jgi:hypothetical protein
MQLEKLIKVKEPAGMMKKVLLFCLLPANKGLLEYLITNGFPLLLLSFWVKNPYVISRQSISVCDAA